MDPVTVTLALIGLADKGLDLALLIAKDIDPKDRAEFWKAHFSRQRESEQAWQAMWAAVVAAFQTKPTGRKPFRKRAVNGRRTSSNGRRKHKKAVE